MKGRLDILGLALTLVLVLSCSTAIATDGVTLIDQARALAGSVTPGDTPGFPVTISQAGSYRLSGNLTVPDENTTAIEITADNVSIDLNGFAILGPNVCSGNPLSCTLTGTGIGIYSYQNSNINIRNGTIRGMGSTGVYLLPFGTVGGNVVTGLIVFSNGLDGINVWGSCIVSGNISRYNAGIGIEISGGTVQGNVVVYNGGKGIECVNYCLVIENHVGFNEGLGFNLGNAGYVANSLSGNNGGGANPQISGGVNLGQNMCGAGLCP